MKPFWSILILSLVAACAPMEPETQKKYDEVMVIHDEVMPKMSDIKRLISWHKKQENPESKEIVRELKVAEEAMWDWMHNFSKPDAKDPLEKQLAYLESEKASISKVSDLMLNAIEKAKNLKKTIEDETK